MLSTIFVYVGTLGVCLIFELHCIYLRVMKKLPLVQLSCTVTFFSWESLILASNHIVAAIRVLGTQRHQREIPSLSISTIPAGTSKLCSQAAVKCCLIGLEKRDIQDISLFNKKLDAMLHKARYGTACSWVR